MPDLQSTINADLFRYTGRLGTRALLRSWLKDPGFRFLFHLRHLNANAPRRRSTTLLPFLFHRTVLRQLRFRYGYDIAPTARIGAGLYIGHFGTVVISGLATIGQNCNLAQGVTLTVGRRRPTPMPTNPGLEDPRPTSDPMPTGASTSTTNPAPTGAPTLGARVWVGPNAVLLGPITIGSDSLIAPCTVVDFDVPPHAVVEGNPARITGSHGSAGLIQRTLN